MNVVEQVTFPNLISLQNLMNRLNIHEGKSVQISRLGIPIKIKLLGRKTPTVLSDGQLPTVRVVGN